MTLTLHLACSEGRKRYFGCNLTYRKVLASFYQHLMAEAPETGSAPLRRLQPTIVSTELLRYNVVLTVGSGQLLPVVSKNINELKKTLRHLDSVASIDAKLLALIANKRHRV